MPIAHFPTFDGDFAICTVRLPPAQERVHADSSSEFCAECTQELIFAMADGTPIACPDCNSPMRPDRALPQNLTVTGGVCSECHMAPVRQRVKDERARRVAAFGEGRC